MMLSGSISGSEDIQTIISQVCITFIGNYSLIDEQQSIVISQTGSSASIPPHSLCDLLSDTCKQFWGRILKWLCNPSRDHSMFWVTDPFARHLELSVAQKFTGIFTTLNRLGANPSTKKLSIMTWRKLSFTTPKELILSVVNGLVRQYPPYRPLLIKELTEDPMVIKKSSHTTIF